MTSQIGDIWVCGFTYVKNMALINVEGMMGEYDVAKRLLDTLENIDMKVVLILKKSSE